MDGFFSGIEFTTTKKPLSLLPECGSCGLWQGCQSPKMKPAGKGRKEILIVSAFPGKLEDKTGEQIVGNAGRELDRMLRKCGVDVREDCVLTYSLICYPRKEKTTNKIEYCNPGEAPIWMGDLTFKPISEVKIGDEVIGWERVTASERLGNSSRGTPLTKAKQSRKKLTKATVQAIHTKKAKVVKVTMASGRVIRCTEDHLWLNGKKTWSNNKEDFKPARVGGYLAHVVTPIGDCPQELKYAAGYMAAMMDGEGTFDKSCVQICQSWKANPAVCRRIEKVAKRLGFNYSWRGMEDTTIPANPRLNLSGIDAEVKLHNWCKPAKKRKKLAENILRRTSFTKMDKVVSIEEDGYETVYGMTTTTGNYVAWGYASKNCRPNILNLIKDMQPKVVILLGDQAVRSVVGHVWKEDVGKIGRWAGWQIPLQKWNCWVCPTVNPMDVLYEEDQVYTREAERHLKEACEITARPWETVPDYKKQVELIYDPDEVAKKLRVMLSFHKKEDLWAFDYETNMLKPDSKEAEIICCSISNGRQTIAFPWQNRGIQLWAFKEFVEGTWPKVASNLDMEERWTRKFVGCSVNGWLTGHDTMLGAHALDSRGGITGLKFQAFVHLGMEDYASAVAPYLKSGGGGNTKNRVREVPMETLLLYAGLDSLLEAKVARKQRKELGIT